MVLKTQLQKPAPEILEKHWQEMLKVIQEATNYAKSIISEHDIFIDNVAKEARTGASYVAITGMLEKVHDDCIKEVTPFIEAFAKEMANLIKEATTETIKEVLQDQLVKKLKELR